MPAVDQVKYTDCVTGPRPNGVPSADKCVARMLQKYCEWLNLWHLDSNDDEFGPYTPETFYGRRLLAAYETSYYWAVVVDVYDGDEGGPTTLTGYFTIPAEWGVMSKQSPSQLWHMVQEFDTMVQLVLSEDEFKNTPEKGD